MKRLLSVILLSLFAAFLLFACDSKGLEFTFDSYESGGAIDDARYAELITTADELTAFFSEKKAAADYLTAKTDESESYYDFFAKIYSDEYNALASRLERYDEEFFAEKMLTVVFIPSPSSAYKYVIEKLYLAEETLVVKIKQYIPGVRKGVSVDITQDMRYFYYFVETAKIEGATSAAVNLYYGYGKN
ncbi:MAG: hypothetical protein J6126_06065 [Clostridia bacterium]|nr:hypothetical protein [Clostridia bacterium]